LISEEAKHSKVLAYITALKKLCNHPKVNSFSLMFCLQRIHHALLVVVWIADISGGFYRK
jgi:hypothetical protein